MNDLLSTSNEFNVHMMCCVKIKIETSELEDVEILKAENLKFTIRTSMYLIRSQM